MSDTKETAGELLSRLGMDGRLWAGEFHKTAIALGHPAMDEGWLIGWFANAIMAGHDRAADQLAEVEAERDALRGALATREASLTWIIENTTQVRIRDLAMDMLTQARAALTATPATPVTREVMRVQPDRETFDAMCAMRDAINEYIPMPSLESDLLQGPENSVFCATVAESVISEVVRLRAALTATPAPKPVQTLELKVDASAIKAAIDTALADVAHLNTIAATIRVNALRHGATDAEVEAFIKGEADFIAWIVGKIAPVSPEVGALEITLEQAAKKILDAGCSGVAQLTWDIAKSIEGREPTWPAGDARFERPALFNALRSALAAVEARHE